MSKTNYRKYHEEVRENLEPTEQIVENETIENIEVVSENEVVVEEEVKPVKVETKKGRVVDCVRLNVRKNPQPNAQVVHTIPKGEVVKVYESESTSNFYKVTTRSKVDGFCMKQYIKLD